MDSKYIRGTIQELAKILVPGLLIYAAFGKVTEAKLENLSQRAITVGLVGYSFFLLAWVADYSTRYTLSDQVYGLALASAGSIFLAALKPVDQPNASYSNLSAEEMILSERLGIWMLVVGFILQFFNMYVEQFRNQWLSAFQLGIDPMLLDILLFVAAIPILTHVLDIDEFVRSLIHLMILLIISAGAGAVGLKFFGPFGIIMSLLPIIAIGLQLSWGMLKSFLFHLCGGLKEILSVARERVGIAKEDNNIEN